MNNFFLEFLHKKILDNTAIGYGLIMGESCPITDLDNLLWL